MIIDLSVPLNANTPVYPGDPATKIEPAGVLEKDGFCDHYISVGTHVGTHIDAPKHMLEGGVSLDQIPTERFVGRGCYIKATNGNFDAVKDADIQAGDIVLVHTGMIDKYYEAIYFEDYPVMSEEIAEFLVSKKIKMVGVDACSVDNKNDFPIHKLLLGGGVLVVENLINLNELAGRKFEVYALPIKLQIDGAPARVIAEAKE